jgi:hypothetical protein
VFTARYGLSPYATMISFVLKGMLSISDSFGVNKIYEFQSGVAEGTDLLGCYTVPTGVIVSDVRKERR